MPPFVSPLAVCQPVVHWLLAVGSVSARQSGPVFEIAELQYALAVLAVEEVGCRDVVQGVVLQGRRGRVELGAQGQRVGRAVAGSGADGADALRCGLQGGRRWRRPLVETVFFDSTGAVSLGGGLRWLHEQLRGVGGGGQRGAEEDVLVLGQVLRWGLLGRTCTVEQLSLQQGQIGLEKRDNKRPQGKVGRFLEP